MMALKVLLGILVGFFLIGCIRLGVVAEYSSDGISVVAYAGLIRIRILPKKQKKAKAPKEKKEKKQKAQKQEKPTETAAPQKKGGKLPMLLEFLSLAAELQSSLRNKLKLKTLTLHLTMGGKGDDPAKSAILYGRAWSVLGGFWPLLEQTFIIEKQDVQVHLDFLTEETTVYALAKASISIRALVHMGLYYGLRGLKIFLKYRKNNKKGGKKDGTSNQ